MTNNVGIIIIARMGSSRCPGKVLRKIVGRSLLGIVADRCQKFSPNTPICIATSQSKIDDEIEQFCWKERIPCFRGDEFNVAQRVLDAADFMDFYDIVFTSNLEIV